MIGGRVLDATALLDAASGDTVYTRAFLYAAVEVGIALVVPATALQDAWTRVPIEHQPFLDLILALPVTVIDDLTGSRAHDIGIAYSQAPGARYDTTAAHVVHTATTRDWPVLTNDPGPLEAINPAVLIERLPT